MRVYVMPVFYPAEWCADPSEPAQLRNLASSPRIWLDDDLLIRIARASRSKRHLKSRRGINRAFEHRESDHAPVMVEGSAGDASHRPFLTRNGKERARFGCFPLSVLNVEHGESPRVVTKIVHFCDGFLHPVTAFGQVYGGAHPVELVLNCALVNICHTDPP